MATKKKYRFVASEKVGAQKAPPVTMVFIMTSQSHGGLFFPFGQPKQKAGRGGRGKTAYLAKLGQVTKRFIVTARSHLEEVKSLAPAAFDERVSLHSDFLNFWAAFREKVKHTQWDELRGEKVSRLEAFAIVFILLYITGQVEIGTGKVQTQHFWPYLYNEQGVQEKDLHEVLEISLTSRGMHSGKMLGLQAEQVFNVRYAEVSKRRMKSYRSSTVSLYALGVLLDTSHISDEWYLMFRHMFAQGVDL